MKPVKPGILRPVRLVSQICVCMCVYVCVCVCVCVFINTPLAKSTGSPLRHTELIEVGRCQSRIHTHTRACSRALTHPCKHTHTHTFSPALPAPALPVGRSVFYVTGLFAAPVSLLISGVSHRKGSSRGSPYGPARHGLQLLSQHCQWI